MTETAQRRAQAAPVHVGIGGWDYDPWRGTFYPAGLPKARQLAYAAQRITAIEINATYYRLQKPEYYRRWAQMVPDDFRFTLKASRFCTNRRELGEAGEAVGRFCAQGFTELGDKLGPILWQLAPTKKFVSSEIRSFFSLLPTRQDNVRLRHAIEVRHESFLSREFVAMAQAAGVAICFADSAAYPAIADQTADFVYARLRSTREDEPQGYGSGELDRWAGIIKDWSRGKSPEDLPYVSGARAAVRPREVFAFMISGAKVRNPAAAEALIARIGVGK